MGADAAPKERRVLEIMSDMENKDMAQAAASAPEAGQQAKAGKADAGKKDKSAKKAKDKKPGFFERLKRWFREMKSELKKVSWPSAKSTMKNVGIVIVCVLIVGLAIGVFDVLVKAVVDALLKLF